jgi:hypothetical protein
MLTWEHRYQIWLFNYMNCHVAPPEVHQKLHDLGWIEPHPDKPKGHIRMTVEGAKAIHALWLGEVYVNKDV